MENPSSPPGILRTCSACGNPVEPGHKFCEICGAKMEELPVCKNCGARFIAPVKFCEVCGTPVAASEKPQAAAIIPPKPEPEPVYEPEPMEPETEPEPVQEPKLPVKKPVPVQELPHIDELTMTPEIPVILEKSKAPAKSPLNKTLIIGGIVILLVIIAGIYFVGLPMLKGGSGGATAATPALPATMPPVPVTTSPPVATAAPTAVPTTPENSLVPLPTQQMPKNQEVFFDVQKDQVNAMITVLFQRGPGENIISYAEVKVTHPDGSVVTKTIKPSSGTTEITLEGSKGTDRVVVTAYMYNGQNYRIKDELKTFKTI
jgi:hypothetical protein